MNEWKDSWIARADIALSPDLMEEWGEMVERHPRYFMPASYVDLPANRSMGTNVEQWRSLVGIFFAAEDVDRALCLMGYESGGNPNAYNPSGASGLMQVLSGWADNYGVSPQDLFDPDTNLRIAADLKARYGWTQWSPYNRGLCQ